MDGEYPIAGVVQSASGELYGATQYGGSGRIQNGGGTIYKITPAGAFTTLYSFCDQGVPCTTGAEPVADLIQAGNGDFYGTSGSCHLQNYSHWHADRP